MADEAERGLQEDKNEDGESESVAASKSVSCALRRRLRRPLQVTNRSWVVDQPLPLAWVPRAKVTMTRMTESRLSTQCGGNQEMRSRPKRAMRTAAGVRTRKARDPRTAANNVVVNFLSDSPR